MIIKKENLQPIVPSGQNWNFEFNPITRELKIVALPTIITGDNNSNVIFIKTPLEYNGVDLLGVNCIINYSTNWTINDKKNQGQVDLTNSCTEFNDYLIYTWVLDSKQTLRTGMCNFSMEFIMNLEEDPYQNQTKYYLTKNIDENQNDYLQISKTNIDEIQKKYWSISSLKATLFIDEGGEQISGDGEIYPGTEIVGGVGKFTAEGGEIFNDYDNNEASGQFSHAQGTGTKAKHKSSSTSGLNTETGTDNQTVVGKYNRVVSDALFVVGNGTDNDSRKNAFEVKANGDVKIDSALILTDSTSGKEYKIYINDGKLQLEEVN